MKKLMSTILALSMTLALAGCAGGTTETQAPETTPASETDSQTADESVADESTSADASDVMSYEEYMAADLDTQVTIQAYVQGKQSWYADQETATVYAQDQDGAYFLYDMACSEEDYDLLVPGTKIQVTGYKSEWSGEVEIIDATFEFIDDGDTYIAEPLDVTDLLGTDELIDYQNQLVTFTGLTVEPASEDGTTAFLYNYDGSGTQGDDVYFNASYNGETYTFTIESYLCDSSTDVYKAAEALQVGQTINMEGFLYWYEGVNPHITSITVAE